MISRIPPLNSLPSFGRMHPSCPNHAGFQGQAAGARWPEEADKEQLLLLSVGFEGVGPHYMA